MNMQNEDTQIKEVITLLQTFNYSRKDIRAILLDFFVCEYVGKTYLGLKKILAIVSSQTAGNKKIHLKKNKNNYKINANGEFLSVIMRKYLDKALQAAKFNGISTLLIKDARTTPLPALYAYMASKQNIMCFGFSYIPQKIVVLPDTGIPMIGTNPFFVGLPLDKDEAFIFDMSVSTTALANVGTSKDAYGLSSTMQVTSNKDEIKYLLPFGGIKGFNFGVLTLLLSGILNGKDVFSDENYSKNKQSSFFYIFIDATFLDKKSQKQMVLALKTIEKLSQGFYKTPGKKYFNALKIANKSLDTILCTYCI